MRPRLHKCAVPHCPLDVPRHLLMCMEHWRMVPAPLRREVTAAWKAFQRAVDPSDGHDAWVSHSNAKANAVAAVTAKVQSKQAALAEKFGDLFAPTDSRDKNDIHGTPKQPGRRAQT